MCLFWDGGSALEKNVIIYPGCQVNQSVQSLDGFHQVLRSMIGADYTFDSER
jgi:hypothetical protein